MVNIMIKEIGAALTIIIAMMFLAGCGDCEGKEHNYNINGNSTTCCTTTDDDDDSITTDCN